LETIHVPGGLPFSPSVSNKVISTRESLSKTRIGNYYPSLQLLFYF